MCAGLVMIVLFASLVSSLKTPEQQNEILKPHTVILVSLFSIFSGGLFATISDD